MINYDNRREEKVMFKANENRYDNMIYRRCGKSGLKLSAVSLGLWKNFGAKDDFANMEKMVHTAFDLGIIHFDLANNYGDPDIGSAEVNFGKILDNGLRAYRDELCISTKAGYDMWPGPYGERNGSRKYLIASLDQSLKRMNLDYVDIFYHHRPDDNTPIEETICALDQIVRSGKALYVGLSNYSTEQLKKALPLLRELHTPFIINQNKYSIFERTIEDNGFKDYCAEQGYGIIAFSPLAQGLLTDKYLNGIPEDSRVKRDGRFLHEADVAARLPQIKTLNEIAASRGQSLAQMALSWVLRDGKVTSVLIGASRPEQILDNIKIVGHTEFSKEELDKIEKICGK